MLFEDEMQPKYKMQHKQLEQTEKPRLKIVLWCVALIVAAVIFFLSAQQASESKELSGQTIRLVASVLVPDFAELSPAQQAKIVASWQGTVRNTAHAFAYFVLGSICLLALLQYPLPMKKRLALAFSISVVYAFTDEIHQLFVDGRAFQWSDLGTDAAGALVGILLVLGMYSCGRGRRRGAAGKR